ncbi:hypothetical protein CNEO4_1460048 [Clostridium neonatale]|nr:hypothetical protein CNEO4_1460048 [Clostridium neonatale]CAI3634667.1 hypothetical protein CNEO2_260047 [Clostridium neonatale]
MQQFFYVLNNFTHNILTIKY